MDPDLELVYVGDPMCSWCWGFAPVVERLAAEATIPLRVVVGGLRPGPRAEPLDRLRPHLERHWAKVTAVTGRPFDPAILDRPGWVYDTMVADTAVVTMRSLVPEETLRFFVAVQRGFYLDGVDVTDPGAYRELVGPFPVDPDEFVALVVGDEMRAAAEADFDEARRLGVTGFPTLLLVDGERRFALALGYAPHEEVAARLGAHLARRSSRGGTGRSDGRS